MASYGGGPQVARLLVREYANDRNGVSLCNDAVLQLDTESHDIDIIDRFRRPI